MQKMYPIIVALLMIASAGYAQEFRGCCPRGLEHETKMSHELKLEMLDLTEEQRNEIKAARTNAEKKIIPLRAEIELKQLDLRHEMEMDNPNRNKIMGLTKDISDLKLKIKQTKIDQKLKIHSILTPEQREQLKKPLHKSIEKKIIKKRSLEYKD